MTTTTVYLQRPPPTVTTGGESGLGVALALVATGAALYYAWTVNQAVPTPQADAKINPAAQWTSTSASLQQPVYKDTVREAVYTKSYAPGGSIPFATNAGAYDKTTSVNSGSVYVESGKTKVALMGPSGALPITQLTKAFGSLWK